MQHAAPRPWIVAGAALVGAGTIAATPVIAPLPALSALQSPATQLTAGFDPFGAWQDVFDTAKANVTALTDSAVPMVAMQQLIANLINGESIDPKAIIDAIAQPSTSLTETPTPLSLSNDGFHAIVALVLPQYLPEDFPLPTDELTPILSFLASPLSGVLMGALGPSIAPLVALGNSVTEISDALSGDTADWSTALQAMADIPANMLGGLLNGATLDLDALIPTIMDAGMLPEGMGISSLSYAFGGLLSPGNTGSDVEGFVNGIADGSHPGIGGSLLNGLGIHLTGPLPLPIDGLGVGPIAAWESLQQIIAMTLGWDGVGNPLDDLAGSGSSAATDVLAELASSFGL
ncbi:outer membrane porin GjpA [[Mycobacterium] nativiensis]|uniref:Outer membrane porin GjpA n=1 Tax=[Mycobacterium] nativiensis TaxID=2855503 RepID=A0ABU5Y5J5_9MYCO|nr:outer membrane porin GjpA [Mycolicibacter sp. MYC340]MEB3034235.1 outer membrane porin GjpA [Mycolicibacter sp. MYC340]